MPSFTDPAHIFEGLASQRMVFPDNSNLKTIDMMIINSPKQGFLLFFKNKKAFGVYPSVIPLVMETIKMLIRLQSVCNNLCGFFPKIIKRNIQMLHNLIHPQTVRNSLCAIAIRIISQLIQTII